MITEDASARFRRSGGMDHRAGGAALKPYTRPEVVMLGNLAALTKRVGANGKNDGGGGNNKTG